MTPKFNAPTTGANTVAVGDYAARIVIAEHEPENQTAKALADLETALPDPAHLTADAGACAIEDIAITPDFHGGKPMPVGVVTRTRGFLMPHAIGYDIGCGMRSLVLPDVTEQDLVEHLSAVKTASRRAFFQGGRDLQLTGRQRTAILRDGLIGLAESLDNEGRGLLEGYDRSLCERDVDHSCDMATFPAARVVADFEDFCGAPDEIRRDAVFGTIGGGNHFVELQVIDRIADAASAHSFGLSKGQVVATVHSGSLGFGQNVGHAIAGRLRAAWAGHACVDGRMLALEGPTAVLVDDYLTGMASATNASFANRLFLGLTVVKVLREVLGREVSHRLLYDAPHNVIWPEPDGHFLHRKGACPARGPLAMEGTPFAHIGEPVILPGSMGDATWILAGRGADQTLSSSAHGAGRRLTRQQARREPFSREDLAVVLPVDLDDPHIKRRSDIVAEITDRLAEEAPNAYRPIDNVVSAMVDADVVTPVARLRPVMTVKG